MAKKVVAGGSKGSGKSFTKVIRMVKSPKTGAYMFKEQMVPKDEVDKVLAAKD